MSLTLPTAYSNSSKLGNIQENWIVQLGFFNGDDHGSGEGGWDAILRANGAANLGKGAISDAAATAIDVDDSSVFTDGDYIKIDDGSNPEIVKVNGDPPDADTINVVRGQMGTTATTHSDDAALYWNNFTPISLADTTVDDVFYHGTITKKPSIRSSIDLESSTAKTGNISLSVINFQFKGDDFSAELFLGTRKYINREVRIYSQLNGDTAFSNCMQVYSGRLIDIAHDDASITLQLTEQRPWDFISIPQDKSSNGIFAPVAYGDYTRSANPAFANNYDVYPMPYIGTLDNGLYFAEQSSVASGHQSHFYDNQLDKFITIDGGSAATSSFNSLDCINIPIEVSRTFRIRPGTVENVDGFSNVANAINGDSSDGTTAGATVTSVGSHSGGYVEDTEQASFKVKMPEIDGEATSITIYVLATIVQSSSTMTTSGNPISGGGTNPECIIGVSTHSEAIKPALTRQSASNGTTNSSGTTINLTTGANGAGGAFSVTAETISYYNATKKLDEFIVYATFKSGTGHTAYTDNYQSTWAVTIKDIIIQVTYQNDLVNEPTASYAKNSQLKFLYSGTDGLAKSFAGGSGVADTGVEAHRDLLVRFTGWDAADSAIYNWDDSFPANTDSGSDLDEDLTDAETAIDVDDGTDFQIGNIIRINNEKMLVTNISSNLLTVTRAYLGTTATTHDNNDDINIVHSSIVEDFRATSAWNIRWWALDSIELQNILEKLQKEFCFIFKWRADGSGSYWIVKDYYSSSDVSATLQASDILNLKIANTPFSGLLTDMRINYEKHPAENRYFSSQTSKDITNNPRTAWNIQSKENIKEINLDMNVNKPGNANPGGGDPNDGFADYYMNLFGDIKKNISCDIVNPAVSYNLETGDIVQFSNTAGEMPVEPFGDNWADYYMITDLKRSPGKVGITAREVG
jgi:hypothetical protein